MKELKMKCKTFDWIPGWMKKKLMYKEHYLEIKGVFKTVLLDVEFC